MRETLLSLGFLVVFTAALGGANGVEADELKSSVLRQIPDERKSGWKLIVNETYGFSFRVPSSSTVERPRTKKEEEYIGISTRLGPKKYWMEVFIFVLDDMTTRRGWDSCSKLILNQDVEVQNGVKVYRGNPRDQSPDAEYVRALCVEVGNRAIYMQGEETDKETPILKAIYASFRVSSNAGKP